MLDEKMIQTIIKVGNLIVGIIMAVGMFGICVVCPIMYHMSMH